MFTKKEKSIVLDRKLNSKSLLKFKELQNTKEQQGYKFIYSGAGLHIFTDIRGESVQIFQTNQFTSL